MACSFASFKLAPLKALIRAGVLGWGGVHITHTESPDKIAF